MADLNQRLERIHHRLNSALEMACRDPLSARLMLATKNQYVDTIRTVAAIGELLFGESKVQEFVPKHTALADIDAEWHFIGHLQTNKVRDVISRVRCVQSVDRPSLVTALAEECSRQGISIDVMIEVNTSGEQSKHGVHPERTEEIIELVERHKELRITGFMTIGALSQDERTVRECFEKLRLQANRFGSSRNVQCELSMGMSSDLEWAIAEGSTIVRVGTAIFGERVVTREGT